MRIQARKDQCLIGHHPSLQEEKERRLALRRLGLAFLLGIGFVCVELIGAYLSGSLALFADAIHMLADSVALGFGLLAGLLASRPSSTKRSYGYYRLEVIAALFNGALLLGMAGFIVLEAYHRWRSPAEVNGISMLVVGGLGFIINVFMLKLLHASHSHNINIKAAFFHVLGDTLSSVAVVASAVAIIYLKITWPDLLASLFVALMISIMAIRLCLDATHILLEATPKHLEASLIEQEIFESSTHIKKIHDFHIWEISSKLVALTCHLEVDFEKISEGDELINKINSKLKESYGISHTTIQLEPWTEDKTFSN